MEMASGGNPAFPFSRFGAASDMSTDEPLAAPALALALAFLVLYSLAGPLGILI